MSSYKEVMKKIEQIFKDLDKDKYPYIFSRFGDISNRSQAKMDVENRLKYTEYILESANIEIKDKVILDAGCGPGLQCLNLAVLGAKMVYGVDILQNRIGELQRLLDESGDNLPIKFKCSNILKTGFEDNYFDAIISFEALSHYMNPKDFLEEAYRMLKVNGLLIISDGNNGNNPKKRLSRKRYWSRSEKGPQGHLYQRRQMIKKRYPDLTDTELEKLSAGTAGMGGEKIVEALEQYIKEGEFPQSRYKWGMIPVGVESGYYDENLLYPNQIKKDLEQLGFDLQIYGTFLGKQSESSARRIFSSVISYICTAGVPISLYFLNTFIIVARKK